MSNPKTLLDLPIEEQQRYAESEGMTLEEWQKEERETLEMLDNHKITGYMSEEVSKRFLKKMMSATQDIDHLD